MAVGKSGRIVLEVEPEMKQRLYSALALERKTLKEWFVQGAEEYILSQRQPRMFGPSTRKRKQ
jgi:hypothetical protein